MAYQLCKNVMYDDRKRNAYNALAGQTFGLSFEKWYQDGYWTQSNIPYTLFDGEKAVANISVNRMELVCRGQRFDYIQLGTVMTDAACRKQGLSRFILNEIMNDWMERCDGIFLFANKTVLDFYPRFGFERQLQYRYSLKVENALGDVRKLDMDRMEDRELLEKYYKKTNPFSQLQVVNNFGLLMFYCGSFMKDNVFYSSRWDAVMIAERDENVLVCFDIYCDAGKDFMEVLTSMAPAGVDTIDIRFTPESGYPYEIVSDDNEDDVLFVLKGKGNLFKNKKVIFPEISHT